MSTSYTFTADWATLSNHDWVQRLKKEKLRPEQQELVEYCDFCGNQDSNNHSMDCTAPIMVLARRASGMTTKKKATKKVKKTTKKKTY